MNLKRSLERINDSMWVIAKYDKRKKDFFKNNLRKKLGYGIKFYEPKIFIESYKHNKLIGKEFDLLGDYIFFSHEKLNNINYVNQIKYTKGLKYLLEGFYLFQSQINLFISNCKKHENDKGYVTDNFFNIDLNHEYKIISGAFTQQIFKIISLQKNKIYGLLGNFKTTFNRKSFSISPVA